MKGYYKCVCGKEFTEPNKFNSHKNNCEKHIINKYGSFEKYNILRTRNSFLGGIKNHINYINKKENELQNWISEKHTCERCGKVMTEKFGSGRFCSRACANSHIQTGDINLKRSVTYKNKVVSNYNNNPKVCKICGKPLNYKKRKSNYCNICLTKIRSEKAKQKHFGGITKGHGNGKGGVYKNIRCDSKYELLFLIYHLEILKVNIIRNKKYFNYISFDGKVHKFYPDFYLPDSNTYIEIKGYYQENTSYKLEGMKKYNVNFNILYWEDIKIYLEDIKNKFNVSYFTLDKLYDNIR